MSALPGNPTPHKRFTEWLKPRLSQPKWQVGGALGGALLLGLIAGLVVLATRDGEAPAIPDPPGFVISPEGDDVPRLSPVKVTFPSPPDEKVAERLVRVEPETPGEYIWLTERTVLFQPEFPGLLRGSTYTVIVPPRPEAGLYDESRKQFTVTGLLTVQQAIPGDADAEVPLNAPIMVQFSRSVAPLTTLAEQRSDPVITFNPPLEGTGEWLNTSIYRFTPKALEPFTTYRMTIKKGLTSAADGVLQDDYTWSFTTLSPAVDKVTPDANTEFAGLRQTVTVTFNQPVDRASAAAAISIQTSGTNVAGGIAWSEGDRVAVWTPAAQLGFLTTYDVTVAKGVKGAKGGESSIEWKSSFKTVGRPGVERTFPANGDTSAQRYGVNIYFTNPMDEDTLEDKISISGYTAADLEDKVFVYDRGVSVNVALRPSTPYTVTFAAGAQDRYGQVMGSYTFSFTTGALQPQVSLALPGYSRSGTYSANTEPILYFHATNVRSADFTLWPLTSEEAQCLMFNRDVKGGGTCTAANWLPSGAVLRSWSEPVTGGQNEVAIGSTSLSGGGPLPKGYYYVTTRTGSVGTLYSAFAFAVVDTVLVTKMSQDELAVWALDHDSGRPVSNLSLNISGDGAPGGAQTTDANGLASFKVSKPTPTNNVNRTFWLTSSSGGRFAATSTNWQQGSYPYQLSLPTEYYAREWVAQLYTDRPIYRPGETVNYKGIVRADDDAQYSIPRADAGLMVVVINSRQQEIHKLPVTTNDFGTFAGSLELPADAPVGDYSFYISQPGQGPFGNVISGNSFLVAEFRKPEFEVTVSTGKGSYVNGDAIDVSVEAEFYFGGALAGAHVEWTALSNPWSMRVKGFERFSFSDYDYWRQAVVRQPERANGSATTGADGIAKYTVPAVLEGGEGAQQYTLSATVTDTNAQAVANSTAVTVHPAELYAGIRPSEYVTQSGSEARIELVTVDTEGNLLPNKSVTVKAYDRQWVTTKVQTPEGGRQYKSEPKDTLITTLTATTGANSEGSVTFTPTKPGTVRLVAEVTDSKGRIARTAAYLWVWGNGFASWQVTNDDTIALVADKEKYEVGETAEILVPAPFEGATGLVTVERGKIITREVRTFATNSERITIPITDRSVPNIFVSVVLYRPPTAEDPVPRYKIGYAQLSVSTDTRVLNVEIRPDHETAQPGETVRYDIKVTDSTGKGVKAEVSAAVVDKAIFALEDERGPNGLRAFWFERGLSVMTASSMAVSVNRSNDVIAELPRGGKGGGGLESDRLRQDFRNTAYWEAQLVTKDDGTASVSVKMPDNLTTWRMAVRAVSGNTQVGEGTNELVSTQPLLLRPALPRFLRVGDSAAIRIVINNATKSESEVKVSLKAEGVSAEGGDRTVKIPGGGSTIVSWPAKVENEGTAKLTFTATGSGGLKDAIVQELPVYLDVTPETVATGGIVTDEPGYEAVYLPPYAILKQGSLSVSVQSALTTSMAGELAYLSPPPGVIEGTERIASRLMATIGVRAADKSGNGQASGAYDSRITTDLATLVSRQRPDGGWAWCQSPRCESDPNVTGWVLLALGEAKRAGITYDAGVASLATSYVRTQLNVTADVLHPADPNRKAFLLAALSAAGGVTSSDSRAHYEQYRSQLANWGKAYLVLAFHDAGVKSDDPMVRALLNDLAAATIASANGNHWEDNPVSGSFMSNVATTGLVALALTRAEPEQPLLPATVRWLVIARGADRWDTSIERAQAITSLTAFAVETGELGGNYQWQVSLDRDEILKGMVTPGQPKSASTTVPLTRFEAGKASLLTFARGTGTGRLYYTLNLHYVTPAKEVEAINRGFAISHQYTKMEDPNTPISEAKLGDTVRVKITILAPADRNYVVVNDLLPAGLEPIDPQLNTIDPALKAQLDAERRAAEQKRTGGYQAPWFRWYYNPWQHAETRDDRTTLLTNNLSKGVYEYIYYARATTPGDFFVAPPYVEETYFPEVFGRGDSGRFKVVE